VAAVNIIGTGSYSTASSSFTPVSHIVDAMDALQVITVGGTSVSSITFTNIPDTYKHLYIRCLTRDDRAVSANALLMQVGSSNSIDSGNNYSVHFFRGDRSSATSGSAAPYSDMISFAVEPGSSAGSNIFALSIIEVLDYANTTKYKTAKVLNGFDGNTIGYTQLISGLWRSKNVINTLRFSAGANANFVENSQFALYGVK
jgi:hypothetical protein